MSSNKTERPKITIGYRVGNLVVVEPTPQRKNGYTIWKCLCDCGNEVFLDTRYLQRGAIKDCGCISNSVKSNQRNLTGIRFGKLVCLAPTEERSRTGSVIWKCQCDCGNICYVPLTQLTQGYKKSCGCLGHPPLKDLIGKRFGQLVVQSYVKKENGRHLWRCLCDCGQETIVAQSNLIFGHTKTCGHLQKEIHKENLELFDGTSITMLKANKKLKSNNKSGYTGIYKNKSSGRWVAEIKFKRKRYYLGSYHNLEDAVKARRRGEEMHEDFLEWYYTEFPERRPKTE